MKSNPTSLPSPSGVNLRDAICAFFVLRFGLNFQFREIEGSPEGSCSNLRSAAASRISLTNTAPRNLVGICSNGSNVIALSFTPATYSRYDEFSLGDCSRWKSVRLT